MEQQFSYDNIGNLKSRITAYGVGRDLIYGYGGAHAGPHAVTSVNGEAYTYDTAGREQKAPDRVTTYESWGLPSKIIGRKQTDEFKYDFLQQRILKLRSDGTHIATVGGLFQRESNGDGLGTNRYYVSAGGQLVAAVVLDETSQERSTHYLHDDRLGSIAAITKADGRAETEAYDPFGTLREARDPSIPAPPPSVEPLGFTERELDPEVGLINMLGRLYDARIAHFATPDPFVSAPLSSQGYNRYGYALNNPLRWTDPTGLQFEDIGVDILDDVAGTSPVLTANGENGYYAIPQGGIPAAGVSDDNRGLYGPSRLGPEEEEPALTPPPLLQAEEPKSKELNRAMTQSLNQPWLSQPLPPLPPDTPTISAPGVEEPNRGTGLEKTYGPIQAGLAATAAISGVTAAGTALIGRLVPAATAAGPLVANGVTKLEELEESSAGNTIAVGLGNRLQEFAARVGAVTYEQLGWTNEGEVWKNSFLQAMNNMATKLAVNLTDVGSPWAAVQRAVMGASGVTAQGVRWGSSTDWELLQISRNPDWWSRITFYENGGTVPNPFQ